MKRMLFLLGIVLMMGGLVQAATYYFEGTQDNLWSNLNNWTVEGSVPSVLPGAADNVRIRSSCLLDYDAGIINSLQIGSGGAGDLTVDGGRIDAAKGVSGAAEMGAVGWDAPGSLTITNNGEVIIRNDTTIGCWANKGTVTVDSGRFFVPAALFLSVYDNNGVFVDSEVKVCKGGIVECYYITIKGGVIDIWNGRFCPWYSDAAVSDLITAGKIIGFGGQGTVSFDTAPWPHTVTAKHNMHPSPDFYETVVVGDIALSWTNMEPNSPGDDVYVDVWFGTEPNKLGANYAQVVTAGQNTTTVTVNASDAPQTYYWQVDSYLYGNPAVVHYSNSDPNAYPIIESVLFEFYTTYDSAPIVNAGVDMITWVNEPVQLEPTIIDDGVSSLTYLWTTAPEAEPNVIFSDPAAEAPLVAVDSALGAVTLTLTVQDEFNAPVSDTVVINVYRSPCSAAVDGPGLDPADQQLDLYFDCRIDLRDVAVLAARWLENYELTAPIPVSVP